MVFRAEYFLLYRWVDIIAILQLEMSGNVFYIAKIIIIAVLKILILRTKRSFY